MGVDKTYPHNHRGQTVLVCGSAPCLLDEFQEAKEYRPEAKVMAINDAAQVIWADFICSVHEEKLVKFKRESVNPDAITLTEEPYKEHFEVDYWFPSLIPVSRSATSAGSAVQVARLMRFSEIIMCGAPMNGGDDICVIFGIGELTKTSSNDCNA